MTSANVVHPAAVRSRLGVRRTLAAYVRLSNVKVYFQWIPAVAAWSLVPKPFDLPASAVLALVLFIAGVIATACCAGTLDDVQGFRDGLDQRTYADDQELRGVPGKPLLTGEITERAAYRFALVMGAIGYALGVTALAVAPHSPLWLFPCWTIAWYAATQYSYGVKLSYHGAGELLLATEAAAITLMTVTFLTGRVWDAVWFEAYLLATLFGQVTVFSSSQDAEIDREFNRMTMAARLSPAANRRLIATVFTVGWAVTATGFATGVLEPWLLVALLPCWSFQVRQLRHGLGRREWLLARYLGWRAFDAGFLALVAVNLVTG